MLSSLYTTGPRRLLIDAIQNSLKQHFKNGQTVKIITVRSWGVKESNELLAHIDDGKFISGLLALNLRGITGLLNSKAAKILEVVQNSKSEVT